MYSYIIHSLAIDPVNTNTIYAGTENGVFKSTNGGASWTAINSGITYSYTIYSLAIDPVNTNTIYAGTENGVFKSTNGGASWTAINSGIIGPHIRSLAIDPKTTNTIYAGTVNGVFKSTDGGASWTAINSGITHLHILSLAIDPVNTNTIYAGTVGGGVFKMIQSPIPPTYTLTTNVGFGGTITPSGTITVNHGENKSFTIKANPGYFIFRILVDGSPVSFNNQLKYTYTFNNVIANHTIKAEFMKQPDLTLPSLTLPTINGIDLNTPNALLQINTPTLTFTVSATDESGIGRMVVKVNGVTQIDKSNLDPTITLQEGMNTVEVTVYDIYGNYTTKSFKVLSDTQGPIIVLPADIPQAVSSSTFTLKGTAVDSASGVSTLTINGTSVTPTLDGNFETELTLTQGTNTITIVATDNLGNTTTKTVTLSYNASQSKSYIITLKVGDPHITINGIEKNIDAQGSKPIIKNSRTLVPIRVIIESLGGTVEWNNTQKKVTITLGLNTIELWIDNPIAKVNGVNTPIDSTNSKVVPEIINGRTYLPIRFISENLGASVDYDSQSQTITIYYFR